MFFGYNHNKGLFKKLVSPLNKVANYFDKSIYDILNLSLPITIGVLANFVTGKNGNLVIIIITILLIVAIWSIRQTHFDKSGLLNENLEFSKINSGLEQTKRLLVEKIENVKGDFRLLNEYSIESHLKMISDKTGLNSDNRISIYFEFNNNFLLLGRFSENPNFKKTHAIQFSIDKGALSKAWQEGYYEDLKCPVYTKKPSSRKPYYEHNKTVYDFSKAKLDRLNMKSCNFIGHAIKDAGNSIGVILFESTKHDLEIKKDLINEVFQNYQNVLARLVRLGKDYNHIIYSNTDKNKLSPEKELLKELGEKDV